MLVHAYRLSPVNDRERNFKATNGGRAAKIKKCRASRNTWAIPFSGIRS